MPGSLWIEGEVIWKHMFSSLASRGEAYINMHSQSVTSVMLVFVVADGKLWWT